MKKILFPVLVLILGAGAGIGAGMFLAPKPEPAPEVSEGDQESGEHADKAKDEYAKDPDVELATMDMGDQFVVPILADGIIAEHVILTIALETEAETLEYLEKKLPKLRAAFIIALYDYASLGAFADPMENVNMLKRVTKALQEAADYTVPDMQTKVLITNFIRQNA